MKHHSEPDLVPAPAEPTDAEPADALRHRSGPATAWQVEKVHQLVVDAGSHLAALKESHRHLTQKLEVVGANVVGVKESHQQLVQRLEEISNKVDHFHQMLHMLTCAVAGIASHFSSEGMTPEETAQVVAKLKNQAAKLEGIAAAPSGPTP